MSGRSPTGSLNDSTMSHVGSDRDAVELGRVVVQDAAPCMLVELHRVLREELLAVRPGRVAGRGGARGLGAARGEMDRRRQSVAEDRGAWLVAKGLPVVAVWIAPRGDGRVDRLELDQLVIMGVDLGGPVRGLARNEEALGRG